MPTDMPNRVRKTYTHDRAHLTDPAPVAKLVVYIRPDQAAWLAEEQERRLARRTGRRAGKRVAPPPAPAATGADVAPPLDPSAPPLPKSAGRNGKYSEMTREAIDLLIEYSRHAEFMAAKLRPPAAAPPVLAVPTAPAAPAKPHNPARVSPAAPPRRWVEGHATRGAQSPAEGEE